ncbi:hypothetical protein I545_1794 [Mycobacterium kansasii 662]|jgi:hypothetical protein|uniref:Uncharacterized protein n=1 Tax=Mycobacterium kansasii 662 TaxID=1299326 RepID=X7ZKY5_MYCKA|nr:hypothetical protein I545_1794 [Mycobacterium kansasii 662]
MPWWRASYEVAGRVDIRARGVPAGTSAEDHAHGLQSSFVNPAHYLNPVGRQPD